MAEINVDFRNIVASKKCAVSSPRIVNLEIGDESPGSSCESAFEGFFLNDQVSLSDVKDNSNLICGYGKQDKNFLIHSQSPLSTSTCDERPSDKIKSNSDTDFDLLDLLNSSKLGEALECRTENFTSKDKMKIIPNFEVSGGLSDLISRTAHEVSEKNGSNPSDVLCRRENTQNCEIDLLDFDFTKNKCSDSLPFNNSSLKAEDNLSELLSSINIEDSNVTQVGSFKSSNKCNSKIINKPNADNEPSIADLSDLLSSIDLQNFNDNKVSNCNQGNLKVVETNNQQCLSDLLSSFDIENSNKATKQKETNVTNLSDLLSSVDLGDSNNGKVSNCNLNSMKFVESKNESCLNDFLSSVDAVKSVPALLNSNPLGFSSSNLSFNGCKGVSDSFNDFTFDAVSCSSSNNSCASSYSERENNSSKFSLTKNNLKTDKVFESDSGYDSIDSAPKEFSFFDYSTDNQSSFNTLLSKKLTNIATKPEGYEDARNSNEEISMSDLLTIVSPEFKNPFLANLNKAEKHESNINNDSSSMLDLIESLNIKSNNSNPHVTKNNSVECDEKLLNYDCVDGHISKKVQSNMKRIDFQADGSSEKLDMLIDGNDNINDDEQTTFIDLRECVKSAKNQFPHTSPIKQVKSVDNQSMECFSPNKILFYCEEKSPSGLSQNRSNSFEFNDTAPRKKSRVNTNQTMFSKALACKPKKDQFLLEKVANIKNELLNSFLYRPVFDCEIPQPILEPVLQSDRCVISNFGRKSFGLDTPCELQ